MRVYRANVKKLRPRIDLFDVYQRYGIPIKDNPNLKEISQIQASDETISALERIIRRGVRRRYRSLVERKQDSMVAFHMLQWAPKTNNNIPFGEIWIYDIDEIETKVP